MMFERVPAAVGAPEMRPLAVSKLNPAGSAPPVTANVGAGSPAAVNEKVSAVPTIPAGSAVGVMVTACGTAMTDTEAPCELTT